MKIILSGLMAVAALGGFAIATSAHAQAQRGMAPNRATMTYVAKAGAGDLSEIQSSQIAVRGTRNPRGRDFAAMLIINHQRTTQGVLAAARAPGMRARPRNA